MSYWVPFCYIFSQMTVTKSMVIPGGSIKFGKFKSISSYLQTKNTPLTPALYPVFTRFYLWSVSYMLCQWGTFFKTVFIRIFAFSLNSTEKQMSQSIVLAHIYLFCIPNYHLMVISWTPDSKSFSPNSGSTAMWLWQISQHCYFFHLHV